MSEPLLVNEKEAARLLGISTRMLRKYKDQIPIVRFGRRKLYDPEDLVTVKEQMKCQPSIDAETKTAATRKRGQLISGSTVVSFQEALAAGPSEKQKPVSLRSNKSCAPKSKDKVSA